MAYIKEISLFVKREMNDNETVMAGMTKYDLFVFLFSFSFTLEVGLTFLQTQA